MNARYGAALGCGLLFGAGLAISQMADPAKVLGFLDVAGQWDASLLFVLGGAVAVTAVFFRLVLGRTRPICNASFERPPSETIDAALVGGAVLFGIGWGIAGFCPGPGIVALGRGAPAAFVFVLEFLMGSFAVRMWRRSRHLREPRTTLLW